LAIPLSATAQQTNRLEVGFHLGADFFIPDGGDVDFSLGAPGGGAVLGFFPPIYLTTDLGSSLFIEPQVAFLYQSATEGGLVNAALQVGTFTRAHSRSSPYVAVHILTLSTFGGGGSTDFAGGGSVGIRRIVNDRVGVRFEARYRRFFDADFNDIALLVGVGALFR
jgi:hypothetical protein